MPISPKELERAHRELRRLNSRDDRLFRTYHGCDFPEFIASLQDNLKAIAHQEFLSRLARTMLEVVSTLRVEGD